MGTAGVDDQRVGQLEGFNVVPGGPSGIPGNPLYATQLPLWLTGDYHTVEMDVRSLRKRDLTLEFLVPER